MLGRIDWSPSRHKLRVFAATLFVAALLFAAVLLLLGKSQSSLITLISGAFLSAISYLLPSVGKLVYLVWMAVGYLLGSIFSPAVSALIFYMLVTPAALLFRLFRRDNLQLKRDSGMESYFNDHQDISDPDHFQHQF